MDAKTMGECLFENRIFIQPPSITPQMTLVITKGKKYLYRRKSERYHL